MAPTEHSAAMEASCSAQQRLLSAIARLAVLPAGNLEHEDLSRLESMVAHLECSCSSGTPRGVDTPAFGCRGPVLMPMSPDCSRRLPESYSPDPLMNPDNLSMPAFTKPSMMRNESDLSDASTVVSWASDDRTLDASYSRIDDVKLPPLQCALPRQGYTSAPQEPQLLSPSKSLQPAPPSPSEVEVAVFVPYDHVEGSQLTIEYAGSMYAVTVPFGSPLGSTFRVPLLVPQPHRENGMVGW